MFADSGVGVRAWQELLNIANGQLVGVIPSDHNPVVADLGIRY